MAVFDPNRKRNARGEQRQEELLSAAGRVFARVGYHEATTNAIAADAGVSPATLYQFFPNKEAMANALAARLAKQMADDERAIDPENRLSFVGAVRALLEEALRFHVVHPEFHVLLMEAPLLQDARQEKEELAGAFTGFIANRLRREQPTLSSAAAAHHGEVVLLIFKGMLVEISHARPNAKARWKQALTDAVLRYLAPIAEGREK